MKTYASLVVPALVIMLVLDYCWLGVIARGFYQAQFGDFFRTDPLLWAAALFYVCYAIALAFFVIRPALALRSLARAVLYGAAFGATAYLTYDLTNLATLEGWPVVAAFVDVAWGTILTAVTAGLTYLVATKVFKL